VEELSEGCSVEELITWEKEVGLLTFAPPIDYCLPGYL
jgi:hypothetical protein